VAVEEEQLELFGPGRLAERPYCMPGKGQGMLIRGLDHALRMPYIQANTPWSIYRIVLDVDYDISYAAHYGTWDNDYGMPTPNWCAVNPGNGHGHLGYEIAVPVARHEFARKKPLALLAALEHALTLKIKADRGYAGYICKNPHHPDWLSLRPRAEPYDLPELSEWVDLVPYQGRKPEIVADCAIGRNCALFDKLRKWAYAAVRQYKETSTREAWNKAVLERAEALNEYTPPLPLSEIKATARSVAKYCWQEFDIDASDKRFSEKQAARGKRGGYASGATRFNATIDKRLEAVQLRVAGQTVPVIAESLEVSVRTVQRWLNDRGDTKP
jgi:hypothetical protein